MVQKLHMEREEREQQEALERERQEAMAAAQAREHVELVSSLEAAAGAREEELTRVTEGVRNQLRQTEEALQDSHKVPLSGVLCRPLSSVE